MSKQLELRYLLRQALASGGVHEADRASRFALYNLRPGKSSRQASKLRVLGKYWPSAWSDLLNNMDLASYRGGFNRGLRDLTARLYKQHPPIDGRAMPIADVIQVEYEPDPPFAKRRTARRIRHEISRRRTMMRATAGNKRSKQCNPMLVCCLYWKSRGPGGVIKEWCLPFYVEDLGVGGHLPAYHATILCRQLRLLGVKRGYILLDRYYAGDSVRAVLRKYGWDFRIRITTKETRYRLVRHGGEPTNTWHLLRETVGHCEAKRVIRHDPTTGKPAMYFVRKVSVKFEGEDEPVDLVLSARGSGRAGAWTIVPTNSMVLVARPGSNIDTVLEEYLHRWKIETFFRSLAERKPRTADKALGRHTFNFTARIAHTLLARIYVMLDAPRGVTVADAIDIVLGIDITQPEFAIDPG